jgi:hypothetical protein
LDLNKFVFQVLTPLDVLDEAALISFDFPHFRHPSSTFEQLVKPRVYPTLDERLARTIDRFQEVAFLADRLLVEQPLHLLPLSSSVKLLLQREPMRASLQALMFP